MSDEKLKVRLDVNPSFDSEAPMTNPAGGRLSELQAAFDNEDSGISAMELHELSCLLIEENKRLHDILCELVISVELYAEGGSIENYTSDRHKSLSDVVDDAKEALALKARGGE